MKSTSCWLRIFVWRQVGSFRIPQGRITQRPVESGFPCNLSRTSFRPINNATESGQSLRSLACWVDSTGAGETRWNRYWISFGKHDILPYWVAQSLISLSVRSHSTKMRVFSVFFIYWVVCALTFPIQKAGFSAFLSWKYVPDQHHRSPSTRFDERRIDFLLHPVASEWDYCNLSSPPPVNGSSFNPLEKHWA